MGFQARKSFKVMPGVRMTVSKRGVSTSAGVRGARVTRTSSGRITRTLGAPGTGISHTKTLSGSRSAQPGPSWPTAPAAPPKPGLTAPRWEKDLYKALTTQSFGDLAGVARSHPEAAPLVAVLDGLTAMQAGDTDRALPVLRWAWSSAHDIDGHPFVHKYLSASQVTIEVANGVSAALPVGRDALGLALAELEQAAGTPDAAIAVVESLDPSVIAAVSLSELYLETGRFDDVVDVTNGITNEDDPTALLLTFRGIALRESGHHTAAREAFKEALKSASRDKVIRHRALLERARCYVDEGKAAMARKDLERVLAEDSTFPGLQEMFAEL
jgi:predicted negative regulator of RcsB-dependent stress response